MTSDDHRASGQRTKYERVLETFARGEAVCLDAPGDGNAVYLATYSGLFHVWFADDAPRPDRDEGPQATHFAYRASLSAEAGDDLEMEGFGPWIRTLVLLVTIDDIEGVPLLDSPFIDPDADTESGIGFRDPDPMNIYEVADSTVDTDHEPSGLREAKSVSGHGSGFIGGAGRLWVRSGVSEAHFTQPADETCNSDGPP